MSEIKYKTGFKYQLFEDYSVDVGVVPQEQIFCGRYLYLSEAGMLTMRNGYCWDGPSGPAIDSDTTIKPSLVHDALYQIIRRGFLPEDPYREMADKVFRELMLSIVPEKESESFSYWMNRKAHEVRCWYFYRAVRAFGSCAVQNPKELMVAP